MSWRSFETSILVVWSGLARRLACVKLFTCALQSEPDVMEVEVNDKGQWRRVGAGGVGDGAWTDITADPASVPTPAATKPSANGAAVEVCGLQHPASRPSRTACDASPWVADVAQLGKAISNNASMHEWGLEIRHVNLTNY
jgi:hypothetical protein